jgi:hypothetical protein
VTREPGNSAGQPPLEGAGESEGSEPGNSIGQPPLEGEGEGEEGDGGGGPESNRRRRHWCPDEFRCWLLVDLLSDTHTYTHHKNLDAFPSFLPSVVHGQLPTRPLSARPFNSTTLGTLGPQGSTGARPNTPPLALPVIDLSVVSCRQCSE